MTVKDFEPHFWFFIQNENDYYLDVNCSYSAFGFTRLIKLTATEIEDYNNYGKTFLNSLANDIQYHALTKYLERNITGTIASLTTKAILKFNEQNNFNKL